MRFGVTVEIRWNSQAKGRRETPRRETPRPAYTFPKGRGSRKGAKNNGTALCLCEEGREASTAGHGQGTGKKINPAGDWQLA